MKTCLLIKLNPSFTPKTLTGAAPRDGREQSHWQEVFRRIDTIYHTSNIALSSIIMSNIRFENFCSSCRTSPLNSRPVDHQNKSDLCCENRKKSTCFLSSFQFLFWLLGVKIVIQPERSQLFQRRARIQQSYIGDLPVVTGTGTIALKKFQNVFRQEITSPTSFCQHISKNIFGRYGLSRASLYAPPDLPHIENWVEAKVNIFNGILDTYILIYIFSWPSVTKDC